MVPHCLLLTAFAAAAAAQGTSSLTDVHRDTLVTAHNDARTAADPPAQNMPALTWSGDLASLAQEWSNKCEFEHGQPDNDLRKTLPLNIGQNLWAGTGTGVDFSKVVQDWDDEKTEFTYSSDGQGSCTAGKVCGHYTQVVWAKTTEVGCGVKYCPNGISKKNGDKIFKGAAGHIVTCNYLKAGNFNTAPYDKGTSCCACPTGYDRCHNKLCAKSGGTLATEACAAGAAHLRAHLLSLVSALLVAIVCRRA